ncbi:MAG TPA: xanthine dehydrogenase family protein molybdopterin-binding subunit, partial [Casimicrobiaceae bacterium]|nr:xanthine dehydrogenase family protein molybdopterin-binding subunit [Casimicrobiaceae bacterium]
MSASDTRIERYVVGLPQTGLDTVQREVPADEAPSLPPNDALAIIGKRNPRADARAKVTGRARYTVDVTLPGMLHGRLVRSPHAHARIVALDATAARR